MNYFLKNTIIFLALSVVNTLLFILFIGLSEYPGGSVGMSPFIIINNCFTSFIISTILIVFIALKSEITSLRSALIFTIIYLINLLLNDVNPFRSNIDLWFYICGIIPFGLFYIRQRVRKNFA